MLTNGAYRRSNAPFNKLKRFFNRIGGANKGRRSFKRNANGKQGRIFSKKTPGIRTSTWNQTNNAFNPGAAMFCPVPQKLFISHKYSQDVVLTCGVGGISGTGHIFSLNDLHDPDKTGVGHQPYGFDQLGSLYNRYKVYKTELALDFSSPSNTSSRTYGCYQLLNPSNYSVSTAGLLVEDYQERPRADAIRIVDGTDPTLVNFTTFLPEVVGCKSMMDAQYGDNYTGNTAGGPANQIAVSLNTCNEVGTDSVAISCRVRIVYHCMWYNPKMLAQS